MTAGLNDISLLIWNSYRAIVTGFLGIPLCRGRFWETETKGQYLCFPMLMSSLGIKCQHNQPPGSYRNSTVPSNCFCLFTENKKDVVVTLKSSCNNDTKLVRDFKVFSPKKKKYSQATQCWRHTLAMLQILCLKHFLIEYVNRRVVFLFPVSTAVECQKHLVVCGLCPLILH